MTVDRYHPALVVLHWLLGLLIVLGLFMGTFSLESLPNSDPAKLDSLRGHMINGALIGCLMIVRLIIQARTHRPPPLTVLGCASCTPWPPSGSWR